MLDRVAMSTDPPWATASLAMAATVWLLPLPGGPEITVTGWVRARTTASVWAEVRRRGEQTGSLAGSAGSDVGL